RPAHDSPPSPRVVTDCLVMDCLCFWRRAKAKSALHLSLAGLIFVSNPYPKASLKSVRTWMAQVLRLGCWRRETERSKGGKQGAEGSSGATEPSCQRKQDVAESFSSRNEHAQSRASSRGVGGAVAARSACLFRR